MSKSVNELDLYKFCPHCGNNLILAVIESEAVKKCNKCGFIFWNKPKPVVSIILHKDGKALMLQRAHEPFKAFWVLPGGFIGYEETPEEAIKREAKEETGLEITINGIVGAYRIDNDPRGVHIDIIFYGTLNGEIEINKDSKSWQYFSPEQLPDKIAYKHREAIADWHAKGSQYG